MFASFQGYLEQRLNFHVFLILEPEHNCRRFERSLARTLLHIVGPTSSGGQLLAPSPNWLSWTRGKNAWLRQFYGVRAFFLMETTNREGF